MDERLIRYCTSEIIKAIGIAAIGVMGCQSSNSPQKYLETLVESVDSSLQQIIDRVYPYEREQKV
jgi:hypothetical protein